MIGDCTISRLTNSVQRWKDDCNKKFNDKFDYSNVGLVSADDQIEIICPIHGKFTTTRVLHLGSKTGCRQCKVPTASVQKRYEKFIADCAEKFPNVEIIECDYVNNRSRLKSKCNVCGKMSDWTVQGMSSSKLGCKEDCAKLLNNKRFFDKQEEEVEKWKERCSEKFNNKYDYSKIGICGVDDRIIIICPEHGEVDTTRYNHENYQTGCRFCSGKVALTTEKFIEECIALHGDIYDYSKTRYVADHTKVIIICPEHGEFEVIPTNFKRKFKDKILGCPFCGMKNTHESGQLYTFKLIDRDLWKVGITINDLKARYTTQYNLIDQSTVRTFKFKYMHTAYKFERHILNLFQENKYDDFEVIFNKDKGDSELLTINPLEVIEREYPIYFEADSNITIEPTESKIRELLIAINSDAQLIKVPDNICDIYIIEGTDILINYSTYSTKISSARRLDKIYSNKYRVITLYEVNDFNKNASILRNLLKLNSKRIYARKCEVRKLTAQESKEFLNTYHLQGNINASTKLGLFHNDELVQVMTFGRVRYSKNGNVDNPMQEIYRLCSKADYTIVGGASKLLKAFKKLWPEAKVCTYADSAISKGDIYLKLGFEFIRKTSPGYYYVHELDLATPLSRQLFTKSNLQDHYNSGTYNIKHFNHNESEFTIMSKNGYIKIETGGNLYFEESVSNTYESKSYAIDDNELLF